MQKIISCVFAIILLIYWLGPYVLIIVAILILIALLINGNSPSRNKPENLYRNNKPIKHTISCAPQNYFEISQQQSKELQSVIDALKVLENCDIYKIVHRLNAFQIGYFKIKNISKSDLFDYISKTANERINTAKRDFVKRECETVVRIVELLKNGVKTEEIVSSIFPIERTMIEKGNNSIATQDISVQESEEQINISQTHSIIISQIIIGLLNNAISRECLNVTSAERHQTRKMIAPIVSQIVNDLTKNAIRRERMQIIEEKKPLLITTVSEKSKIISCKQDRCDENVCPIESVPYWEHTYVYSVDYLHTANKKQKQFYHYFKAQFLKERYIDIKDNSNYAFVLMFDLADDYKKHKNYELLKQQLNTLAENYSVVAGYINRTILQVVTTVNQNEAEKALRSYDKSRGQLCRWVTPNEIIDVQGIKLTRGNYYIGECFRLPDNIIRENIYTLGAQRFYIYGSVLNPKLSANDKDTYKNVFCSYKDMSPAWRYEYLMWLSGKRNALEVPIEILLFYLYGCEIRMFIDSQTTKEERRIMLLEVIDIYKSMSFESSESNEWLLKQKLSDFIGCATIKYFFEERGEFDAKSILGQNRMYQDYYFTHKIADKKTLSPEDAFDIAYETFDMGKLIPSMYIPVAKRYFMDEFTESYKELDVKFGAITTQIRCICFYNNNGYFNSEKIDLYYSVDSGTSNLWEIHNLIKNCYYSIESLFRRYNRAKKRSGGNETVAAIQLLPDEIEVKEIPKIQALIARIENEMQSDLYLVKPIDWILALWEYERQDEKSIHKEYADSIIRGLRRIGFDIVPDYEIDKKRFNFGDTCVIYKNLEHLSVKPTIKYERSDLFIKLASYIVHADNVSHSDIAFVEQQLGTYNNTAGNHLHLMASIRWRFLSKKQPIDKHAKDVISTLTSEQRTFMGNALIRLACINGDIYPKRIDILKKVLPLLGIEADNIHSQIHRMLTDNEGFAVVEKKSDAVEFTINGKSSSAPKPVAPSVIINQKKLRIFEQQTKTARELLSEIFVDEEDAKPQNVKSDNPDNTWVDILEFLFAKEIWKREEIEDICKGRGLLLGAVLEQINDFAYEKVDDTVIEDDGDNIYVTLNYKEQLL